MMRMIRKIKSSKRIPMTRTRSILMRKTLQPIDPGDYPWAEQLAQNVYWMDRYGRRIRITRMSDRYLSNALRFAMKASQTMAMRVAFGPQPQGDHAQDSVDRIIDDYFEYRVPLIEAIVEEQELRAMRPKWVEKILDKTRK